MREMHQRPLPPCPRANSTGYPDCALTSASQTVSASFPPPEGRKPGCPPRLEENRVGEMLFPGKHLFSSCRRGALGAALRPSIDNPRAFMLKLAHGDGVRFANRPSGLMTPTSICAAGVCMRSPQAPGSKLESARLRRGGFSHDRRLFAPGCKRHASKIAARPGPAFRLKPGFV